MAAAYAAKVIHHQAPLELAGEFVSAVMRRDFHDALVLCQALLLLEPDNKMYLEFEKVLTEAKARKITFDISNDEEESDTEEDENNNEELDSDNDSSSSSSDSGNSNSNDSDDDDSDLSGDSSDEDDKLESDDDEISPDDLKNLNLLVGGLSISRSR